MLRELGRGPIWTWSITSGILLLFGGVFYCHVRRNYFVLRVSGNSMYPILKDGQKIRIRRIEKAKRVIVGDVVVVGGGEGLSDHYVKKVMSRVDAVPVYRLRRSELDYYRKNNLSEEWLWVEGLASFSIDSRSWGYVPRSCVVGVAVVPLVDHGEHVGGNTEAGEG